MYAHVIITLISYIATQQSIQTWVTSCNTRRNHRYNSHKTYNYSIIHIVLKILICIKLICVNYFKDTSISTILLSFILSFSLRDRGCLLKNHRFQSWSLWWIRPERKEVSFKKYEERQIRLTSSDLLKFEL